MDRNKLIKIIYSLPKDLTKEVLANISIDKMEDRDLNLVATFSCGIISIYKNISDIEEKIEKQHKTLEKISEGWNAWKDKNISNIELDTREMINEELVECELLTYGYEEIECNIDPNDEDTQNVQYINEEEVFLPMDILNDAIGIDNVSRMFLLSEEETLRLSNYVLKVVGINYAIQSLYELKERHEINLISIKSKLISWRRNYIEFKSKI